MRILLTGGSGLVGSNILEHPRSISHQIFAPKSKDVDLQDFNRTKQYLSNINPDIIIHAAGKVGGIQANLASPVNFLVENLDIGKNIVLAAKAAKVPRLLNIGSSCMYPKGCNTFLTEEMLLSGKLEPTNEGYALAKIVAQKLCEYISQEQGIEYKTIIPCNIYGRHDSFLPSKSHLLPAIIYKLHKAVKTGCQTVEIWGDGCSKREFMYAADLADCIFECVDRYDSLPATMNVGLGKDFTVNEYYETAAEIIGFSGKFVHDLTKPVGMSRKVVSIDKQLTWGWKAQTPLASGIKMTYDYFIENYKDEC